MKKRLISLILLAAMGISTAAFATGCGSTGNTASESLIKPLTLTIAMITEEETTPEGIQVVQDALNKITENELNTHVVLQLYTEEEYDAAIEAKIAARLEYKQNNKTDLSSFGTDEDKVLNEYGREVTLYPEPYENQIDIFLLNGINNLDKYMQFPKPGVDQATYEADPAMNSVCAIASLDSYLTDGTANLLTKYISQNLMNNLKVNEELKAIPSNGFYGNSEYLLINKELFDKYSYNIDDVTDLVSLEGFLMDVATKEEGVTPLYNYGSLGLVSVTGKDSAIAAYIPENADPAAADWTPESITDVPQFKAAMASVTKYASICGQYPITGVDISGAETGKFAAGFVSTDSVGIADYQDEYYTVLTQKAMATTDQVYDNAFAVFQNTSDPARCMQVIQLIQTDRDFHNTLLYGVENVTYTVDEDTGLVSRKHEGTDGAVYSMDIDLCGNLFVSKPNDEMSSLELAVAENDWAKAKEASRNIFYSPYMGFELAVGDDETNRQPNFEDIDTLESLYFKVFEKFTDYPNFTNDDGVEKTYETFDAYYTALGDWLKKTEGYLVGTQIFTGDNDLTVKKQYIRWWDNKYGEGE